MYNLFEYNQNYSMESGSLWNCYSDKIDDVNDNATDGKSFKYKTNFVRKISTKRRTTTTVTTKSIWNSATTITTTNSTSFKCWIHYSTQIS